MTTRRSTINVPRALTLPLYEARIRHFRRGKAKRPEIIIARRGISLRSLVRQAHIQGLIETWNILRDEQAVKQIRQGIADIEAGRVVAWENARMKPNFK